MIKAIYISRNEENKISGYIDLENETRIRFGLSNWRDFIKSEILSKAEKSEIFSFVNKMRELK